MELFKCKCIINSVKLLKAILEEEQKQDGEKKELYSFDKDRGIIDMNVSFKTTDDANKYLWKYSIDKQLFREYFFPALNKYKNEILQEMISKIQEDARKEKEDLFLNISELIVDFNDVTKTTIPPHTNS